MEAGAEVKREERGKNYEKKQYNLSTFLVCCFFFFLSQNIRCLSRRTRE